MLDINAEKLNTLLIWDAEEPPEETHGKTVLWRSLKDGLSANTVSMPKLVEKNAHALKHRYLAWIYSLGESKIQGRRLVDHLELRLGFSYWWMTLSLGKCNYSKSTQIGNAFKLMAFEDWLVGQTITHVNLSSPNAMLAKCIGDWCVNMGIIFNWQNLAEKVEPADQVSWLRHAYQFLPPNLRALTWLIYYLVQRWPLKGIGLKEWSQSKGEVAFYSYLCNLVPEAVKLGKFESRYWAHLPDALQRDECKTNWLHIYVKDELIPNASKAATVIGLFNETGKGDQVHVTLDTFLSWRVVLGALRDWRLVRHAKLKCQDFSITQSNTYFNLWPLIADDWKQSFYGVEALNNLLNLNLHEAALDALPAQRIGVYLQENQGWEAALVHTWRAAGHGDLIGSPNALVRFWDLRYFFDPRSFDQKINNALPMPDLVAINGPAAMSAFVGGSYPATKLLEVEALRYLYLAEYCTEAIKVPYSTDSPLRVLALGDYVAHNTHLQLSLLEQAATLLPKDTVFIFKPHPYCPIDPVGYPGLSMVVTAEPLSTLLTKCDLAYSSSLSAAAVDAYCAGLPVISVLDSNKLNMSPLRDTNGVAFVSTPQELALILKTRKFSTSPQDTFFMLDSNLPRWRKLLMGCK